MTDIEVTKKISANIKKFRIERGLTQAQLAELIEMEQVSISRIESGHYNISLKSLERFAKILKVQVIDLIRKDSTEIQSQANLIADILHGLSEEERETIIRIVRDVAHVCKSK